MPKYLTQEEAYTRCISEGKIVPQKDIDLEKIKSMLEIADEDLEVIKELKKTSTPKWNTLYKLNYDVLHTLAEAFLSLDKVKSLNHQCLFAYLCVKHPELELDWDFFERIRTKRNGIQYYGVTVDEKDWKEVEMTLYLYINLFKKEIKKKIKEVLKDS